MDLDGRSAKGLGHILHSLVADIEGIEGDFETLEQFFMGPVEPAYRVRVVGMDKVTRAGPVSILWAVWGCGRGRQGAF
ncbi:hypothetical protein GTA51_07670 [Desulfovibrio aerotolerans]|uniref:Uncharacterized protein n=1 Tax=Solidesulfovibrio aerotolerans TaxID=295255 RepID=A0A7C9MKK9_9BACT|nr:hypothetical protein [Solidesulfovibrio aerotolerans]MYL83013.1 hypothetical protein [Solidesulfovibrio aerotolerans]